MLMGFFQNFYNVDVLGKRVSELFVRSNWMVAVGASPTGTVECVTAWLTDFRKDLARIDVPTLVIHGDADRIVPIEISGKRTREMVKGSRLVVVKDGPHGVTWTHAEDVSKALLEFLGKS
jgi:pimeloyl-ACP methyl ester carboxylesterase